MVYRTTDVSLLSCKTQAYASRNECVGVRAHVREMRNNRPDCVKIQHMHAALILLKRACRAQWVILHYILA